MAAGPCSDPSLYWGLVPVGAVLVLGGAMLGCPRGAPAHTGAMVMLLAASPGARGCPLMGIWGV